MVEPTPEQLHWNQLRKQHLLDEKVTNYYEVAETQLGLHSTDYWTPYFSVWEISMRKRCSNHLIME